MFFNLISCLSNNTTERDIDVNSIPPGIWAYLGDAFFDLIVRNYFIREGIQDSNKLHQNVVQFVNAKAQATLLREIKDHLTEEELKVMRRGRNSNAGNVPRNANVADYRYSTAFEAVLGYLVLSKKNERIEKIISLIEAYIKSNVKM